MNGRDKVQRSEGRGEDSPQGTCLELLWSFLPSGRWLSGGTSAPRSGLWCARFPGNGEKKKCEQATLESVYGGFFWFMPTIRMNEWMNLNFDPILTILWTISMSSLRASWTPLGSPSMRTRPLRSESCGIRTDTLYCSLIRLTVVRVKKSGKGDAWCDRGWKHLPPVGLKGGCK